MEFTEAVVDRWLERGNKFFRANARNPVIRAALLARGLTNEELARGWKMHSTVFGYGGERQALAAGGTTEAGRALDAIDAWDSPAYTTAKAVLRPNFGAIVVYLFDGIESGDGPAALAGVERFLDRISLLREGNAEGVDPEAGKAAVELLAVRKVVDPEQEARLRELIATARRGAQPEEVTPAREVDPKRNEAFKNYTDWLHGWREVARMSILRRDQQISLGLAQRKRSTEEEDDESESDKTEDDGTARTG